MNIAVRVNDVEDKATTCIKEARTQLKKVKDKFLSNISTYFFFRPNLLINKMVLKKNFLIMKKILMKMKKVILKWILMNHKLMNKLKYLH